MTTHEKPCADPDCRTCFEYVGATQNEAGRRTPDAVPRLDEATEVQRIIARLLLEASICGQNEDAEIYVYGPPNMKRAADIVAREFGTSDDRFARLRQLAEQMRAGGDSSMVVDLGGECAVLHLDPSRRTNSPQDREATVDEIASWINASPEPAVPDESKWPCFWCGSMQAHETGYPGGMSTVPACAKHAAEYSQEKAFGDVRRGGDAGRGDAAPVADVGGAAGPGAGPHPAGGDDASGDAGGAGVGRGAVEHFGGLPMTKENPEDAALVDDVIARNMPLGGSKRVIAPVSTSAPPWCPHGVSLTAWCATCVQRGDDPRGDGFRPSKDRASDARSCVFCLAPQPTIQLPSGVWRCFGTLACADRVLASRAGTYDDNLHAAACDCEACEAYDQGHNAGWKEATGKDRPDYDQARKHVEALTELVIWMTGSADFGAGGVAEIGWGQGKRTLDEALTWLGLLPKRSDGT